MEVSGTPLVVALMGLPGSGTTALAEALAPRLRARIVCRDTIRAAMFRPGGFTDAEKEAAFQAVLEALAANCRLGHCSIVDGMPFSRPGELEAVTQTSERHGGLPFAREANPAPTRRPGRSAGCGGSRA